MMLANPPLPGSSKNATRDQVPCYEAGSQWVVLRGAGLASGSPPATELRLCPPRTADSQASTPTSVHCLLFPGEVCCCTPPHAWVTRHFANSYF